MFLQVLDSDFFAGREAFAEQMHCLSDRSRDNRPIDPRRPVRMPGDQAARGIAPSLRDGIAYDAAIWTKVEESARQLNVVPPRASQAVPSGS